MGAMLYQSLGFINQIPSSMLDARQPICKEKGSDEEETETEMEMDSTKILRRWNFCRVLLSVLFVILFPSQVFGVDLFIVDRKV
jgi:hypothetical protein